MGKGTPWNKEEEDLLKAVYLDKSKEEIMELFPNRTWKAIRNKAVKFNLKRSNDYESVNEEDLYRIINGETYKICKCCRRYLKLELKYFPKDLSCDDGFRNVCKECKGGNFVVSDADYWTEEEVEILIKEYSNRTNKELIEGYFPNKKLDSIKNKAYKLNLNKSKETMKRVNQEKFTDETKKKMSITKKSMGIYKGKNNPMYGTHRAGELNPNWKGGITPIKTQIMRTEEYIEWRTKVFKRDNYTCQCCGEMTHDVEAHHLNNFADFIDERFDIDNGITLCKSCHNPNQKGSYHNLYGTLHNTREEFEEYLEYRRQKELEEAI